MAWVARWGCGVSVDRWSEAHERLKRAEAREIEAARAAAAELARLSVGRVRRSRTHGLRVRTVEADTFDSARQRAREWRDAADRLDVALKAFLSTAAEEREKQQTTRLAGGAA